MKTFFIWFRDNLDLSLPPNLIGLYSLIVTGAFLYVFIIQFNINGIAAGIISAALGIKLAQF